MPGGAAMTVGGERVSLGSGASLVVGCSAAAVNNQRRRQRHLNDRAGRRAREDDDGGCTMSTIAAFGAGERDDDCPSSVKKFIWGGVFVMNVLVDR